MQGVKIKDEPMPPMTPNTMNSSQYSDTCVSYQLPAGLKNNLLLQ
jgi:hypothetical protein